MHETPSMPIACQPAAGFRADGIKALMFDVFGTVVDYRTSVARALAAAGAGARVHADWEAMTDEWRAGYMPATQRVRQGERPWADIDVLHREILDSLLERYGLEGLDEAARHALTMAWHRLDPWPDSVAGLSRLKRRYIIGTLSNGSVALLVGMARHAGLPWDVVLSAELVGHYKLAPQAYDMAPRFLQLAPHEILMVAAHPNDLHAAARQGLRTAYVHRPLEKGPRSAPHRVEPGTFDLMATDFCDLAAQLGT